MQISRNILYYSRTTCYTSAPWHQHVAQAQCAYVMTWRTGCGPGRLPAGSCTVPCLVAKRNFTTVCPVVTLIVDSCGIQHPSTSAGSCAAATTTTTTTTSFSRVYPALLKFLLLRNRSLPSPPLTLPPCARRPSTLPHPREFAYKLHLRFLHHQLHHIATAAAAAAAASTAAAALTGGATTAAMAACCFHLRPLLCCCCCCCLHLLLSPRLM